MREGEREKETNRIYNRNEKGDIITSPTENR